VASLQKSGHFDPTLTDALVWRALSWNDLHTGQVGMALTNLKINTDHHLVLLSKGLYFFSTLFIGGKNVDFEKTITFFKRALNARPDDPVAWTYLGRTYYFYARFFDFLEMADQAEECLEKALNYAGEGPNFMIHNTLGAVSLLRGRNEKALIYNRIALEAAIKDNSYNIHNVYSGIGKVYAREGRYEEAHEQYTCALNKCSTDVSVRMAMAELHLLQGDLDAALDQLQDLAELASETRAAKAKNANHPSLFLTCCRIHLARKDYSAAHKMLRLLFTKALLSSRDFSLACLLIATFPEELLFIKKGEMSEPVLLACRLIYEVTHQQTHYSRQSPIAFSGAGSVYYLRGDYLGALQHIDKAIAEREKWWPADVREYLWTEDARDLYLKAMSFFKLANESSEKMALEKKAKACFDEAEKLYLQESPPIESIDIIERFRAKAKEVLGIT